MTDYIVVHGDLSYDSKLHVFADEVGKKMADGYTLLGTPFINAQRYVYQALIKKSTIPQPINYCPFSHTPNPYMPTYPQGHHTTQTYQMPNCS